MKKIAVFISGGGTDLQSLIDGVHEKSGLIRLVVSSRGDAYGLERAKAVGIETMVLPKGDYDSVLLEELERREVEWIVLAGFLKILSPGVYPAFSPAYFEYSSLFNSGLLWPRLLREESA